MDRLVITSLDAIFY